MHTHIYQKHSHSAVHVCETCCYVSVVFVRVLCYVVVVWGVAVHSCWVLCLCSLFGLLLLSGCFRCFVCVCFLSENRAVTRLTHAAHAAHLLLELGWRRRHPIWWCTAILTYRTRRRIVWSPTRGTCGTCDDHARHAQQEQRERRERERERDVCMSLSLSLYVYMYICIYTHYIYIYIYIYTHYIYIYIYIHVYIHIIYIKVVYT